jgi:hypothetical protein
LQSSIENFLKDLDSYFYGPNFWQAGLFPQVKNLTLKQALWKPSPDRHCIYDVVLHLINWKWFSVETLKGNHPKSMRKLNWVKIPKNPDSKTWKADVKKLRNLQEEFKSFVKKAHSNFFDPSQDFSRFTREVIYHDCYHCGQIGILRAMQGLKPVV